MCYNIIEGCDSMNKKDKLIYTLSKGCVIFIFIYFLVLIIFGMIGTTCIVNSVNTKNTECDYLICSFKGSISISVMLCSIYYIKCMYKACIDNRIEEGNPIKQIGNIAYFLFRPIFVAAFCIVLICFILSGMYIVTTNLDYIMNDKFVYLCMVSCSFLGFSAGKFFDRFQQVSNSKIDEFKI